MERHPHLLPLFPLRSPLLAVTVHFRQRPRLDDAPKKVSLHQGGCRLRLADKRLDVFLVVEPGGIGSGCFGLVGDVLVTRITSCSETGLSRAGPAEGERALQFLVENLTDGVSRRCLRWEEDSVGFKS
jgi:hypothetical protein